MPQRPNIPIEVINKRSKIDAETGCRIWLANKDKDGYGRFSYFGKLVKAHRMSFKLFVGDIPEGLLVLHKCHNRACISPEHLYLGTPANNSRDMTNANRQWKGEQVSKAKVTEKDVIKIRCLYEKENWSLSAIGRRYNINPSTVQNIVRRETWKHVA